MRVFGSRLFLTAILGTGVLVPGVAFAAPAIGGTPAADSPVEDVVAVSLTVTSPDGNVIVSVTADIGGIPVTLKKSNNVWSGNVDIGGLPTGPVVLTATATDATGAVTTLTRNLKYDHRPALDIVLGSAVARPAVRISATCADDDFYPCESITVKKGLTTLASVSGTATSLVLDQVISLAPYEEQEVVLRIETTDTAGAVRSWDRTVLVDSNPRLVPIAEPSTRDLAAAFDVDTTRVLYSPGDTPRVVMRDLATGTETDCAQAGGDGRLTATGFVSSRAQLKDGLCSPLTEGVAGEPAYRANARWATWHASGSGTIYRRDLVTGVDQVLATGGSLPCSSGFSNIDVNEAGDVAWTWAPAGSSQSTKAYDAYWYSNATGVVTKMCRQVGATTNAAPGIRMGDERAIVAHFLGGACGSGSAIATLGPIIQTSVAGPATLLASGTVNSTYLTVRSERSYLMTGGWSAFLKRSSTSIPQKGDPEAWTRSPTGVVALAHPAQGVQALVELGPNGELFVDRGMSRYFGKANGAFPTAPLHVSSAFGKVILRDGKWYMLYRGAVFEIDTSTGGPAPVDGGADAGGTDGGDAGMEAGADGGASTSSSSSSSGSGGTSSGAASSSGSTSGSSVSSGAASSNGSSGDAPPDGDDGGCSVASSPAPHATTLLTLLGLAFVRRRRAPQ